MGIDHFPSVLKSYVEEGFGFVTAAEGFFLLSGYVAGLSYARTLAQQGSRAVRGRAVHRAATIYLFHVSTILVVFAAMRLATETQPWASGWGWEPSQYAHPFRILCRAAVLLHQPKYGDILPMYCVFCLLIPTLVFFLSRERRWVVVLASVGAWLLAQTGIGEQLLNRSGYTINGWFNILAWQLLFVIGLVLGFHRTERESLPRLGTKSLVVITALAVALFLLRHGLLLPGVKALRSEHLIGHSRLGPLRLLNTFVVAVVVSWPQLWPSRFWGTRSLAFLGRHSLPVFSFHIILTYYLQCFLLPYMSANRLTSAGVAVAMVGLLYVPAWVCEISKRDGLSTKSWSDLLLMRPIPQRMGLYLVVAAGLVLALPLIWCGYPKPTHDGPLHLCWVEYFSRQLWSGELYPRWLSAPNHGFGAATFFMYAPLPYYAGAAFWPLAPLGGRAGFALGWAAALALMLSGLGALFCLRRFVRSERAAVVGALLYMAGPYHLAIDLLERGANAEFWAFVWLPFIISALEDLARALTADPGGQPEATGGRIAGRLWATPGLWATLKLSLVLAGLFLTHPLTAIVFAPIAASFALYRGWRILRGLCLGTVLALGLSAAYWLPLTTYRPWLCSAQWGWFNGDHISGSVFFPTLEWSEPFTPSAYAEFNQRLLQIFLGFALIYGIAILASWSLSFDRRARWGVILWAVVLVGCLAMMLPIATPLYNGFPPLRFIQFSWRFLADATLAHATLAALLLDAFWKQEAREHLSSLRLWVGRLAGVAVVGIGVYSACVLGANRYQAGFLEDGRLRLPPSKVGVSCSWDDCQHIPSAVDNVKEGALELYPDQEGRLPKLVGTTGQIVGKPKGARQWLLEVETTAPSLIVIPQFWFPGWQATDAISGKALSVRNAPRSGLVQVEVPPGKHSVELRLGALWAERLGYWVSLATACSLGLVALLLGRGQRPPREAVRARSEEVPLLAD